MAKGLEWVDAARADAQAQVADPIVAVGFLQPGGSWGAFGLSKLNPVGGSVAQADANKAAGGLAKAGGFKPKVATKVTIDVASTGQRFELEATMIGGGFNDALLAEIAPARSV